MKCMNKWWFKNKLTLDNKRVFQYELRDSGWCLSMWKYVNAYITRKMAFSDKKKPSWGLHNTLANIYIGKLQITPLKSRGVWILHLKVSKFGFYILKFGEVWIFYSFRFQNFDFTPWNSISFALVILPSIFSVKCHKNLPCMAW